MKKDINIVSFILLFFIIGLYSCNSSQNPTPISYQDIDSIIISTHYPTTDILTYNKFYYDKDGKCTEEIKMDISGKDTIFYRGSFITANQREEIIKDDTIYVERLYISPTETADLTMHIVETYIKTPSTTKKIAQSLKMKRDGNFITETSISPISVIDTFGITRTYTFNGLISREQFFDPETQLMSRQIIYTYDSAGNILSKAIKEKQNPSVYTYDYTTYDEDGNWKIRNEYLNKKQIATATQEVYRRK